MQTHGADPPPPYGPKPYGSPHTLPPGAAPPVWTWYRVYAGAMAFVYLVVAGFGLFFLAFGSTIAESSRDPADAYVIPIMGVTYAVLGFVFMGLFGYGLMMPRRPWAWIYGLVLICIGMTSLCCLPATIPLLIFWIKPEMKAFFGRS
jgi:hypothetical protein